LFAIRNLSHNNIANQDWIAALEAKSAVPHPVLDDLELTTSLDSDGKVQVKSKITISDT
jgi:Spinocerebellar ataxia type 10 protein domain